MLNDKRIKSCLFVTIRQRRLQSPAVSACSQPFCRRSYGVTTAAGRHYSSSNSSKDEDEDSQAPVPAATIQGRQNRQWQQLHQLLTTAANYTSWRHVLASRWCRADMLGSVKRVLRVSVMDGGCPVCRADVIPW